MGKPVPISKLRRGDRCARERRGISIVFVLALLAIAMGISYTMLRTQATTLQINTNVMRRDLSRQAAYTGISAALRKMHDSSWAGVGVNLTGTVSATETYEVTFTTGDTSLSPGDADWQEYPYRVTLVSTGTAADQVNASFRTTHRVRAVVQLVRRQLSDDPVLWSGLQNHTIYQWANQTVAVELPVRIEGPVHLQGPLSLFNDYPYKSIPFHGKIDEVAIFDKALSAGMLDSIYQQAWMGSEFSTATNRRLPGGVSMSPQMPAPPRTAPAATTVRTLVPNLASTAYPAA